MEILRAMVGLGLIGGGAGVGYLIGRVSEMNAVSRKQEEARQAEWARGGIPMCQNPRHAEETREEV